MKKAILLFSFILANFVVICQSTNMVENGSFEIIKGKVKGLGNIEAADEWKSVTQAKADLFVKESKLPILLTSGNTYGKEDPKEGDNYAGLVAYSPKDKIPRNYITSPLTQPMLKGKKYCVSMYISLAEGSKFATNQLGINFSKKKLSIEDKKTIVDKTSILHAQQKVVNATYGWEKICGTYIAEGGEEFITIGNFTATDKTKNEKAIKLKDYKGVLTDVAYYFVDDITVTMVDQKSSCDCGSNEERKDTYYHKIVLLEDKMTPTQRIEAHTAFFQFGKYELQETNRSTIDAVIKEMKANPNFIVELFGHLDVNEAELAVKKPLFADLANRRIREVMKYMIENGIDEKRLISSPKDEKEPNEEILEDDDEDLKLAKNRRVMFKVKES
jgi:outer membrane protein OmpA-like peptidoglycan-associated protein